MARFIQTIFLAFSLSSLAGCGSGATNPPQNNNSGNPPGDFCPAGWSPSINDSTICCPDARLYFASDGVCYPNYNVSPDAAADLFADLADEALADCLYAGFDEDFVETSIIQILADRTDGYSASDELAFYGEICGSLECHPGDPNCRTNCDSCFSKLIFLVYSL